MTFLLFGLFALTLLGIAVLHRFALHFALIGLCLVAVARVGFTRFDLAHHLAHEWEGLLNLGGLLLGFALLADHFEHSGVPQRMARALPMGTRGAFLLLVLVFALSTVLDNIAAALVGGSTAAVVFRGKVHVGYLAAIVAASNAGGAPSVLGDTTTTMMWLSGKGPWEVAHAAVGSVVALLVFGGFAARQQCAFQPERAAPRELPPLDGARLAIVVAILVGAVVANLQTGYPALGVWATLLLATPLRSPHWSLLPGAAKGMAFLLALVVSASLMPVESLPAASSATTFALGVVSSCFDNIPLTKLALTQGGYDWGFLAFAVGYGGSMLWFGSSAGVALTALFPSAKSTGGWLRHGWHVPVAYAVAFAVMLWTLGWHPEHGGAAKTHPPAAHTR